MKKLMPKRIGVVCALAFSIFSLVGCNKEINIAYDYNANDYITKLGDYKNTVYTPDERQVSDEDVEKYIEGILHKSASWTEFTDEKIALGDKVSIEVRVVDEDNNYISSLSTNDAIDLELGSGDMSCDFEGFEEAIVGLVPGRTTQFYAKVISEGDYLDEYKGQTLGFTVAVDNAYKGELPELTDEFVTSVSYGKYSTVDAYKTGIKKSLQYNLDTEIHDKRWEEIVKQIMSDTEVSGYPEEEYNKRLEANTASISNYAMYYNMDVDEYCKERLDCDSIEDYTKESLLLDMILQKVAKDEKIVITAKEYKDNLDKFAKKYGYADGETLVEQKGAPLVQKMMLMQKTIDFIYDKSKPKNE